MHSVKGSHFCNQNWAEKFISNISSVGFAGCFFFCVSKKLPRFFLHNEPGIHNYQGLSAMGV